MVLRTVNVVVDTPAKIQLFQDHLKSYELIRQDQLLVSDQL